MPVAAVYDALDGKPVRDPGPPAVALPGVTALDRRLRAAGFVRVPCDNPAAESTWVRPGTSSVRPDNVGGVAVYARANGASVVVVDGRRPNAERRTWYSMPTSVDGDPGTPEDIATACEALTAGRCDLEALDAAARVSAHVHASVALTVAENPGCPDGLAVLATLS